MLNLLLKPTKYESIPSISSHDPLGGHLGYGVRCGDLDIPKQFDITRKIDPIDDPGKFDVSKALVESDERHQNIPFVQHASLILSDWDYCKTNVIRNDLSEEEKNSIRERSHRTKTKPSFLASVLLLINWALFEECRRDEIYCYSKYFQVPKGNDLWRVIADSRIAGRLCHKPFPVNFPHIRTILLEMAALGATYCVVGDFKFWFYQMAISTGLRTLFGIECSDLFCRLSCLPQGWSWSPRLAQCMAWTIILHCEVGESKLGVNETWTINPPQFIRLKDPVSGSVVGLIFLWLDNILIACQDPKLRRDWYERLVRNAKLYNARWKHLDEKDTPNYLGIHFQTKKVETIPHAPTSSFKVLWSHENERIGKWRHVLNGPVNTAREVATHVGIVIWHHMVSLEPLFTVKRCINVLRRIAPKMKFKSWWDKPLQDIDPSLIITETERAILKSHVKKALNNPLCSVDLNPAATVVYACTDACKVDQADLSGPNARKRTGAYENGKGFVIFGPNFATDHEDFLCHKKRWNDSDRSLDIHLLELMAVEWALEYVPIYSSGVRLILGCDNTIAVSALNNGYSTCDKACAIALRIREKCKGRHIHLELVWVPTKENAADPPSRGLDADGTLNVVTWNILHGAPPTTKQTGRCSLDEKKVIEGGDNTVAPVSGLEDDLDEVDDSFEAKILEEFSYE